MTNDLRKVALFNDTRPDGHFGCSLVIRQLVGLLRSQELEVSWFWPVGKDWHGAIEDRLAGLDAIVVNGEGTIHRTSERDRARWLTELGPIASKHGLPSFLVNAGLHDIDHGSAANLRAYTGIYVRDRHSRTILQGYGIASQVLPDLSMSADFAVSGPRSGVCVTDSVLPDVTERLRFAAKARRWRYRSLRFQKKGKLRLGSCLSDLPWFLVNRYRPESLPRRFAAFTARHRLVVTGRYHMVAYCLLTRTPFVAVESNTPKIGALLTDVFGERSRLIEPDCLATFRPEAFDHFTVTESAAISAFLAAGRDDSAAMIGRIRETLADPREQSERAGLSKPGLVVANSPLLERERPVAQA